LRKVEERCGKMPEDENRVKTKEKQLKKEETWGI